MYSGNCPHQQNDSNGCVVKHKKQRILTFSTTSEVALLADFD